jgi:hypothetical protein
MEHVHKVETLTRRKLPVTPLRVTTVHLSRWERFSTRMKETGMAETHSGCRNILPCWWDAACALSSA